MRDKETSAIVKKNRSSSCGTSQCYICGMTFFVDLENQAVNVENITRISHALGGTCTVHLVGGEKFIVRKTFDQVAMTINAEVRSEAKERGSAV